MEKFQLKKIKETWLFMLLKHYSGPKVRFDLFDGQPKFGQLFKRAL